jgi:hypothetical protein
MGKLESLGRNPCRRVSGDDRRHCDRLSDHTEDETEQSRPPDLSTMLFQNPPHLALAGLDAFAEGELDAGAV